MIGYLTKGEDVFLIEYYSRLCQSRIINFIKLILSLMFGYFFLTLFQETMSNTFPCFIAIKHFRTYHILFSNQCTKSPVSLSNSNTRHKTKKYCLELLITTWFAWGCKKNCTVVTSNILRSRIVGRQCTRCNITLSMTS